MEKKLLTYYDIKYASSSKIFEAEQIQGLTPDQIQEGEKLYALIVEKLEKGEPIEEGFFGAVTGGVVGALVGPAVMKSICKVLGIEEGGVLGRMMTSRLVTTALGISIGK